MKYTNEQLIEMEKRTAARLPEKDLVASFLAERAKFYMALPTFKDFGTGWLVRLFHIAQDVTG